MLKYDKHILSSFFPAPIHVVLGFSSLVLRNLLLEMTGILFPRQQMAAFEQLVMTHAELL